MLDIFLLQVLHTMYDKEIWDQLLEPGYKRISIVRHPWNQFKSFFSFFNLAAKVKRVANNISLSDVEAFQIFLQNLEKYVPMSYTKSRNVQAFNFGYLRTWQKPPDPVLEDEFLEKLAKEMDLIMITDYFYHSMVLLKEQMCWSLNDVIIGLKNRNRHPKFYEEFKLVDDKSLEKMYSEWATMDYKLFNFFNLTFWQKVTEIENLDQKVESYSNVVKSVYDYCSNSGNSTNASDVIAEDSSFVVEPESNYWKESFLINPTFCSKLQLETRFYVKQIKIDRNYVNVTDW